MSHPLRKIEYERYNAVRTQIRSVPKPKKRLKKRKSFFALVFSILLLSLYGYYVCPYNDENYLRNLGLISFDYP